LQRKQKDVQAKLTTVGSDYSAAGELNATLHSLQTERDAAEVSWMSAAESLEQG